MPRDRMSRLLDEFSAVTNAAPRPESPARRSAMTNRLPLGTLTGASLVIVAIAVAAIVFGRPGPVPTAGASPSALAVAAASAPTSEPSGPPAASTAPASAIPAATPTPAPTIAPCDPAVLAARITLWEGAAGSRFANVELKNTGSSDCVLADRSRPELVGGDGTVLIDGKAITTSHRLVMSPGVVHTTAVGVSNYCGATPVPPVTVAFVFADGEVKATPVSPTDATVPPCNGAGVPSTIDMHPWSS
jgi:hypothetical protein